MPHGKRRRWFQISLRSLLVSFLMSGILFGILGPRWHYARQQHRSAKALAELRGTMTYLPAWPVLERHVPESLAEAVGEDFFLNVVGVDLYARPIQDADLEHVTTLAYLQQLHLSATQISDEGLRAISHLRRLEVLELDHTRITDAGLVHLARLRALRELDLRATGVTAEGLLTLRHLESLERLYILDTPISPKGVRELRAAFPNTKVYDQPWRTSAQSYP